MNVDFLRHIGAGDILRSRAESAALASRLDSEDAVVVSELARVELMSVFHRRMRERKWTRERFQVASPVQS